MSEATNGRGVCSVCERQQATGADWGKLVPDDLCWAAVGSLSHFKAECAQLGYARLVRVRVRVFAEGMEAAAAICDAVDEAYLRGVGQGMAHLAAQRIRSKIVKEPESPTSASPQATPAA